MQTQQTTKLEDEVLAEGDLFANIIEQYRLYGFEVIAPLVAEIDLGDSTLEEFLADLDRQYPDAAAQKRTE